MLRCSKRMAGLRDWPWRPRGRPPSFGARRNPKFPKEKTMSRDFDTNNIDKAAIEREARRLRAQVLASGMRSVRDWTVAALQRRISARTA